MYEEAVRINEVGLGADHHRLGPPLANVARTLSHLGRHDDAIATARRAVEVVEKARGPEHPELVTLLSGLGHVYTRAQRYEDAARVQKRAIEVGLATQGDNHVHVAYARQALATTLLQLDDSRRRSRKRSSAETQLATAFEQAHPQHGVALATLGRIEARMGKTADAREHLERAVEVLESTEAAPEEIGAAKKGTGQAGVA